MQRKMDQTKDQLNFDLINGLIDPVLCNRAQELQSERPGSLFQGLAILNKQTNKQTACDQKLWSCDLTSTSSKMSKHGDWEWLLIFILLLNIISAAILK